MRNQKLVVIGIAGGVVFACCGGICLLGAVSRFLGIEPAPTVPRPKPPVVKQEKPPKPPNVKREVAKKAAPQKSERQKPKEPSDRELHGSESLVVGVAQDAVRSQLKAPRSAKFPREHLKARRNDEDRWVVTGEVDAQNEFGVMLRKRYTVTLQYHRDAGEDEYDARRYELIDCVLWEHLLE